jgi:hypothetical protein
MDIYSERYNGQAGIQPCGQYVRQQIEQHNQHSEENRATQNHGVVAIERSLHEEAAQSRDLKHSFHHE